MRNKLIAPGIGLWVVVASALFCPESRSAQSAMLKFQVLLLWGTNDEHSPDPSHKPVEPAVRAKGGAMLITADHGNAEMLIDPVTGGPHTAHTTNPVPFIVVSENSKQFTLKPGGSLRDISPTILAMLEIEEPKEMTGHDLRVPLKKS